MKLLLCSALLLSSLSVFASPLDELLGTYKAKDGDGKAIISKTLITERTLFEPAVYEYDIQIERKKDDIERSVILEAGADGKSLSGSDRDDCDNPDCHAFDSFDVEVKKVGRGAQVSIQYEGYDTEDGSDEVNEFSGKATFIKK